MTAVRMFTNFTHHFISGKGFVPVGAITRDSEPVLEYSGNRNSVASGKSAPAAEVLVERYAW